MVVVVVVVMIIADQINTTQRVPKIWPHMSGTTASVLIRSAMLGMLVYWTML